MLASFFYQGEVPEAGTLLDMATQALVSESSGDGDLDSGICRKLIDGLAKAWLAVREHEEHGDTLLDAAEAEALYVKLGLRAYIRTVKRDYPHYECEDGDGVIWWPEGLTHRDGWPRLFIAKLAEPLGEIEGDRSVALFKYMAARKAEEEGGGVSSGTWDGVS